jgi:uncharacterized protein with NRDE domain
VEGLLETEQTPDTEAFMEVLQDRSIPPDAALPRTGVGLEWERQLGSIFIHSAIYGTRSSTVLLMDRGGTAQICERTFDVEGFVGQVDLKFVTAA